MQNLPFMFDDIPSYKLLLVEKGSIVFSYI